MLKRYVVLEDFVMNGVPQKKGAIIGLEWKEQQLKSIQKCIREATPEDLTSSTTPAPIVASTHPEAMMPAPAPVEPTPEQEAAAAEIAQTTSA